MEELRKTSEGANESAPLAKLLGSNKLKQLRVDRLQRRGDELRRALIYTDDTDYLQEESREMGALARCRASCGRCFDVVRNRLPLRGDVSFMEARYGSGTGAFFRFFRYHVLCLVPLFVAWSYLLIAHFISTSAAGFSTTLLVPFAFLYRYIGTQHATAYTSTALAFIPYIAVVFIALLVREDRRSNEAALLSESDDSMHKYSRVLLTLWDFSLTEPNYVEDYKLRQAQRLRALVQEEERRVRESKQSATELRRLRVRRVFGFVLLFVVLSSTIAAILLLQLHQATIVSALGIPSTSSVASFAVPIAVTVMNGVTPVVLRVCVALQRWSSPAHQLKVLVIARFVLKLVNLIVLVLTYAPLLLASVGFPTVISATLPAGTCAVDYVGTQLLFLYLADFAAFVVMPLLLGLLHTLLARIRKRPSTYEFDDSSMMVSLIYSQSILFVTLPYFPIVAWLCVPLAFFSFKWNVLITTKMTVPPTTAWSPKDTGKFFMIFSFINLVMATLNLYAFIVLMVVDCGPHANAEPVTVVMTAVNSFASLRALYAVVSNAWLLLGTVTILVTVVLTQRNLQRVLSILVVDVQQQLVISNDHHRGQLKKAHERIQDLQLRLKHKDSRT